MGCCVSLPVGTAYSTARKDGVRDRSPLYGELSRGVASDPEVIGFLLTLPREKRQPNLFLSAVRYRFGTPAGWDQFRSCVLHEKDAPRAAMLARWPCSKSAPLPVFACSPTSTPTTMAGLFWSRGLSD